MSRYFAPSRKKGVGKKKELNKRAIFLRRNQKRGKAFFKQGARNSKKLSRYFDLKAPSGFKGVFLPSKFRGKKIAWDGERPVFRGQGAEMVFVPGPGLPMYEGEPNQTDEIEAYLDRIKEIITVYCFDELPDGYDFSIVFGGFEYLKGIPGSPDRQACVDAIMKLLTNVVSSRPEVVEFFEGILCVRAIKQRGKPKRKKAKRKSRPAAKR